MNRHPAAEAAGRAIAEALDQPWATLSINDQAQLALAGEAALEACRPFVKYEVLARTALAVPGNGTKDREFKEWLRRMAAAAQRMAYRR
ncbi:hypothetical protein [Arthrobacter sp. JSM 101049]|uniref:hypothetical protein n=1 Tax=Arthrobacter sp. JSM 101049 TaxID=929097 RepID=UPI0035687F22